MRIDSLHLINFKGFEDQIFDFHHSIDAEPNGNGSFHVLIGQNGKGKTSALDALAVATGSWLLGVRGEDSRHIATEDIRVKVLQYGDTQRIERQLPVSVEAHGQVQGQQLTWKRELHSQRTTSKLARNIKNVAEKSVKAMQRGDLVTLPLIAYYGTGRLWQEPRDFRATTTDDASADAKLSAEFADDLAAAFASRLAGYRYSIDPRTSPRELLRWLHFEQQLAVQQREESTQFQIVKSAIQQAIDGCQRADYHLRLGLLVDIKEQPRLPFGMLSDGQRNMLALVGDLAIKAAQLNPHLGKDALLQTPGVVLIDELDLHLHPRWQQHLVEDLRRLFPEVQFIATTHSPFIIQTLRPGELITLDTQSVPETTNLGIEEIARGLMDVPRPEVSPRYREMVQVAKDYLTTLEEAKVEPPEKLAAFKQRLADSIAPYADNPAYQAFLEMKRVVALGE
ncbi:MAG: AAA family ATPase [Caldilineaceae bacterium]